MIGVDTGFFIEVVKGNPQAVALWEKIENDAVSAASSGMTIYELKKLSLKGEISIRCGTTLINSIIVGFKIIWMDNLEIFETAANLSHGNGIRTSDSLILSSFLLSGITTIYTTDTDFLKYKKKGITIINLLENG